MVTHPAEQADVYRALADPTRRAILSGLLQGERSVNRIASQFVVSRPAVSKHLRLLKEANLVSEARRGKERVYRLNAEPLREVDEWLESYRSMWNVKLRNLKRHLEENP
jgi:DNA-binding transcriptional ArsR family regulator